MKAYIKTLDEIIGKAKESSGGKLSSWQLITFQDVFFRYADSGKTLTVPEFILKKGDKVCIIGTSGEGKTTFFNLLVDFLKPEKGSRRIDGKPYAEIKSEFFQRQVAIVSQETELFNLSLRENITLGKDVSDERILEFFDNFDLRSWLDNLPEGLETVVGEKGVKLSAGQKQRINLIRGCLLNREIILLDEPTSHLDAHTEKKVLEFLQKFLKDKTAIIITHRDVAKLLCDRFYIIDNHVLKLI